MLGSSAQPISMPVPVKVCQSFTTMSEILQNAQFGSCFKSEKLATPLNSTARVLSASLALGGVFHLRRLGEYLFMGAMILIHDI